MPPKRKSDFETNLQAVKRQRIGFTDQDLFFIKQWKAKCQKINERASKHQTDQKHYYIDRGHTIMALVFQHGDIGDGSDFYPIRWRKNLHNIFGEKMLTIDEELDLCMQRHYEDPEAQPEDEERILNTFNTSKIQIAREEREKKNQLPVLWKSMIARPDKFIL